MGLSDLPGEVVIEAVIRSTLAGAGMKAGATAGLIFFGPAGAVILPYVSGTASLLAAPKVRHMIEKTISPSWSKEIVEIATLLKSHALDALDKRLGSLNRESKMTYEPNTIESWLYARKLDDIMASAEQRADIESQNPDTVSDGHILLGKVVAAQILDPTVRKTQLALIQKLEDKPKARDALRKGIKHLENRVSKAASEAKS